MLAARAWQRLPRTTVLITRDSHSWHGASPTACYGVHRCSSKRKQRRSVHTAAGLRDGTRVLRHIAEQSRRPFPKWSLDELLSIEERSHEERLFQLEDVLHVGISKIVCLLQDLPMGFGRTGPIRSVIEDYSRDVHELLQHSPSESEQFLKCVRKIYNRHRGLRAAIAKGLFAFQKEITGSYEAFGILEGTKCADATKWVPAFQKIELALDELFTIRTTCRLLLAQCGGLTPDGVFKDSPKVIIPLECLPARLMDERLAMETRHVGAVCLDTSPSSILVQAYGHARHMCSQDHWKCPEMLINDVPSEDYLKAYAIHDTSFPYVDTHLYFVFFEVLKNALITSMLKAGPSGDPAPIHASLISGTSLQAQNERILKISDSGEGIRREDRSRVWSYFYSTRHASQYFEDIAQKIPSELSLAASLDAALHLESSSLSIDSAGTKIEGCPSFRGRGLGLPVSRTLLRYFGGEIEINSIPRRGSEVYIYL